MNTQDLDTVARTLWGEARGEGFRGMLAVGWVIRTRAEKASAYLARLGRPHPLFGDGTPRAACLVRRQFSCWDDRDPNRSKMLDLDLGRDVPTREAIAAAAAAITGLLPDPTDGADHYHAMSIAPPIWTGGATVTVELGRHRFYRDVR